MKKIITLGVAIALLASYSASAQIAVAIGEPIPVPGYVIATYWPSQHYDIHRHRHNDYWAGRSQEEHDRSGHDDHR